MCVRMCVCLCVCVLAQGFVIALQWAGMCEMSDVYQRFVDHQGFLWATVGRLCMEEVCFVLSVACSVCVRVCVWLCWGAYQDCVRWCVPGVCEMMPCVAVGYYGLFLYHSDSHHTCDREAEWQSKHLRDTEEATAAEREWQREREREKRKEKETNFNFVTQLHP